MRMIIWFYLLSCCTISSIIYPEILIFPKLKSHNEIPLDNAKRKGSYPYICGDTFRAICDFIIDETNNTIDTDNIKDGDIIFVANDQKLLDFFFNVAHKTINVKYILITHNGDKSHFDSYLKYLDDDNIIGWFGTNLTVKHRKAYPIPIGIANPHWSHGNSRAIEGARSNLSDERNILLYMNFLVRTNKTERGRVAQIFSNKKFCYKSGNKNYKDYLRDLKRSRFVLSPNGNGIDCHRTWEALLMDAIPIVSRSNISSIFEDLPVVIVDDWNNITQEFLLKQYEDICLKKERGDFNLDKLFADYWINKIDVIRNTIKEKKILEDIIIVDFDESMKNAKDYKKSLSEKDERWKIAKQLYNKHLITSVNYSDKPIIPKIIHHIWLGSPFPKSYKRLQKTWLDLHPDWEYKLWTDKEVEEFGLVNKDLYDAAKNYGAKSDIARMEILYKFGGLYIDTDFECLQPFDFLHHTCDFYSGIGYDKSLVMHNGLIGSIPGHPVLLTYIQDLKDKKKKRENANDIMDRTGPFFFTKCFFKGMLNHAGPSVILPVTYFYPWPHYHRNQKSPQQIKSWIKPESLGLHHWYVSWLK